MEAVLRLSTWIRPGGRIEVSDPQLPSGKSAEGIVIFTQQEDASRRSVVDILAEAPGHLAFQNAEAVDTYLREERDAWER